MGESWDFMLADDFNLTVALGGERRDQVLRALGELAAEQMQRWRSLADRGLTPDQFRRFERVYAGLGACRAIAAKMYMLSNAR